MSGPTLLRTFPFAGNVMLKEYENQDGFKSWDVEIGSRRIGFIQHDDDGKYYAYRPTGDEPRFDDAYNDLATAVTQLVDYGP